ncbi:MAG TPA: OmpA family protein [Terriglobales bacterium]|nr:OmpA family protein [Terriglobales bacterium]
MHWSKRALPCVLVAVLGAAPAAAQIVGHPLEISGGAGYFHYDTRAHMKDGPAYKGSLGLRIMSVLSLEGMATFGPTKSDTLTDLRHNFFYAGLDARWNLRPADGHIVPFLLTGVGYGASHTTVNGPPGRGREDFKLQRGAGNVGAGVLWNIGLEQRTYLRLEARDFFFRDRDAEEFSNDICATVGLTYVLGGRPRDQDLDGVRDWLDKCPNTTLGCKVDANGCPKDSDGDGVCDGIDQCPDTPKGCTVDAKGCPADADGDGVCDGLDACPNTPKGCTVDVKGCPSDADGDGVCDGVDKCPDTPKGCTVDASGCPIDSDGDGVCDGVDKCPGTPKGLKVDANGCPMEVMERETELMDTGKIRLQNIEFETGKADIKPESYATLDAVGYLLTQWPTLRIEISGHTDDVGGVAANQTLSLARAKSVLAYVEAKFPGIDSTRFTVKGYGKSKPLVPNTNAENRARNRRVEFTVLNKEVLQREIEHRRMLREGEAAPPEGAPRIPMPPTTPAPPDTTQNK